MDIRLLSRPVVICHTDELWTQARIFVQYKTAEAQSVVTRVSVHDRSSHQCLLFFDFLWDRCGDLDLERDFLADFLGVLDRDLLDRFGVRGDGDLLEDFLLLARGESLYEDRDEVSLE